MAKCRSCGEEIVWMVTKSGKKMPADMIPGFPPTEGDIFDPKFNSSHFATCPNAAKHRKPKG